MARETELRIGPLHSGGIMANYLCSSRCGHCAYFCGPDWSREYITEKNARRYLSAIRRSGCISVHIGGGEPFLGGDRLANLVCWCHDEGVTVEYVETNSSWFASAGAAEERLLELMEAGLHMLLVSMSPFHNEFIPWRKVAGVLAACERVGMAVFPWTEEMARDVTVLDHRSTHSGAEYEDQFGPAYFRGLPNRYWISPRGRAIHTFREFAKALSADEVAHSAGQSCPELFDVSHFHVDLYGNYVPGVCSGLAIDVDDLGGSIDRERYRFLSALMDGGVGELLRIARDEFGYAPERTFSGKCDLCYDIRRHLVTGRDVSADDLQPAELYRHMR